MWSPSTQLIVGSVTYAQAGTVLSVAFILLVGAVLMLIRVPSVRPGRYLPLVAFGVLGWLMLTPGLISRYFIYAIAAVILCRHAFSLASYLSIVCWLTVVTLLTSFGHIGLDFLGYGTTTSFVNPLNNGISRWLFALFSDDRMVTVGTLANTLVLVTLGVKAAQNVRSPKEGLINGDPVATPQRAG
jgi:hypothetical protein